MQQAIDAEKQRLEQSRNGIKDWRRWGPYLSERQWGTVREDYSPGGTAWDYLTHDQARNEPIAGARTASLVFRQPPALYLSLALWDGRD
jgi:hypothetical protein